MRTLTATVYLCFSFFSAVQAQDSSISDVPLESRFKGAPPGIMFVMDDSLSMDAEILVREESGHAAYVFDGPGDHGLRNAALIGRDRMMWQYQWHGFNRLYYDPEVDYAPWPGLSPADPENPRSHPMRSGRTLRMNDTYLLLDGGAAHVSDAEARYTGPWTRIPGRLHFTVQAGGSAVYRCRLPKAGIYEVLAYADPGAPYWDNGARYAVVHAGDDSPVTVIRAQGKGNGWVGLGRYPFSPDEDACIVLERIAPETPGDLRPTCADDIVFVPAFASTEATDIKNAHYYVRSGTDGRPYLVNMAEGGIRYYAVDDDTARGGNGNLLVEPGELVPSPNPPADVRARRSPAGERRNFANWYSYHRSLRLSATAAAAESIVALKGVRVGLFGVNAVSGTHAHGLNQPVVPVKLKGEDETDALLDALYRREYGPGQAGTPLRTALQRVGRYFDQDDGIRLDGGRGNDSPYAPAAEGGACQRAVAVVVTDGDWNGPSPGVGNVDGDDGGPYADRHADTLADVAMAYYENDLSAALAQKVFADSLDDAEHQHMTTYTLGLGGHGRIDSLDMNGNNVDDMDEPGTWAYGADPGFREPDAPAPAWPDPSLGPLEKRDDLFHAAVNGHGLFFGGGDPRRLSRRLMALAENIAPKRGSAASGTLHAETLSEGAAFYEAAFDSDGWSGELTAFPLDPATGELIPPGDAARFKAMGGWEASRRLTADSGDLRRIVTYGGVSDGIPFRWPALTDFQKTALCPGWETDREVSARGERIVSYLRGGIVEGFRKRPGALGDFVHCSPVVVSGGAQRKGIVYAGGNDGMLHAFDAETGEERFAYVPGLLFHSTSDRLQWNAPVSRLRELVLPDYTHRFYVDLTPTVARVYASGSVSPADDSYPGSEVSTVGFRTLLIGGLGKGGKGYYALDVTKAEDVSDERGAAELVLWEYPWTVGHEGSGAVDGDLGLSFSRPAVVRSNWVKGGDGAAEYQWVVIFGNGYESPAGQALLYVLDLEGNPVRKIRTDPARSPGNGLSTPSVVDVDGDNRADYAYAGDMLGNLWKFDLTAEDPADWDVAFHDGGVPMPLFRAAFAESGHKTRPQPITTQPDVMVHCSGRGYMVVFGTGRFLADADMNDTGTQTVYGIWDYGDDMDDSEYPGALIDRDTGRLSGPARLRLLRQEEIDWRAMEDGRCLRTLSDYAPVWAVEDDPDGGSQKPDPTVNAGWFFDLPGLVVGGNRIPGERIVKDPFIRDGRAVVVSMVPGGGPCDCGGLSMIHEMDACTGGRLKTAALDYNGDGRVDPDDAELIDIRTESGEEVKSPPTGLTVPGIVNPPAILRIPGNGRIREVKIFSASTGNTGTVSESPEERGMVSWREWNRE